MTATQSWIPPEGPWTIQIPLWNQPPPHIQGWWPRLMWRFQRHETGALLLDQDTLQHIEDGHIRATLRWDTPFVIHLSRQPLVSSFVELGVTLYQTQNNATVAWRALVPQNHLARTVPRKQESADYVLNHDLNRLWSILSFYADLHAVDGLQGFDPNRIHHTLKRADVGDALLTPGSGLRGIIIGQSTYIDALEEFGDDCQVNRYEHPTRPGSAYLLNTSNPTMKRGVWQLNYSYNSALRWDPGRPDNQNRPSQIRCDRKTGLVTKITVGAYQKKIMLRPGIRQGDSFERVLDAYGHNHAFKKGKKLDIYTYAKEGLIVWVTRKTQTINAIIVVAPEEIKPL